VKGARVDPGRLVLEEVDGGGVVGRMAEFRHGSGFELADAFAGEVEVCADFFEGSWFAAVEAVAKRDDEAVR
jgi:hypothetical protein